jgi:chromosome transmission fidelity protein 1
MADHVADDNDDDSLYPSGASVAFPYETPYPQQVDLMDALLSGLKPKPDSDSDDKSTKILLLESPTGTGKSLSLACASLTWLDHQEKLDLQAKKSKESKKSISSSPTGLDWLDDWKPDTSMEQDVLGRKVAVEAREELSTALTKIQLSYQDDSTTNDPTRSRQRRENWTRQSLTKCKLEQRKLMKRRKRKLTTLDEEDLGGENNDSTHNLSPEARLLLGSRLDGSGGCGPGPGPTVGGVTPGSGVRKIIYAARTHSQLSQFVSEVQRTKWGKSIRLVTLGSRSNGLCGHFHKSKKTESALSEACLDLQKSSSQKCPYNDKHAISTLSLQLLSQPTDIEEAGRLGQVGKTCAYYATRQAVAAAQLVVVPYSMLLSSNTRQAVGLDLTQSLVLVDEAHNLPEAIRATTSANCNLTTLQGASTQLSNYTTKYLHQLGGQTLHFLGQLRRIITALISHLEKSESVASRLQSPSELVLDLNLDSINLFPLLRYIERSRLSQKLLGFLAKDDTESTLSKHVSPMSIVESMLHKLLLDQDHGKIVTDSARKELRYVLLHPAVGCPELFQQPYGVCLVGGTLRPFGYLAAELVQDVKVVEQATQADAAVGKGRYQQDRVTAFSCSHVVSPNNVLLQSLSKVGSTSLDFRHATRSTPAVLFALGTALLELCRRIPHGLVIFVPSYSYEAKLIEYWKSTGVYSQLEAIKSVFREPKSSSQVEATLQAYSEAAASGALLFSVVGGKLSEGINFADDLARGVVVVGLPYPDPTDPVLVEKLKLLDSTPGGMSGRAYYQTLCMRAINQSVGRAIRHAHDYASIILVDVRYVTDQKVAQALPQWLTSSTKGWQNTHSLDQVKRNLDSFFQTRKVKTEID